MIGTKAEKGHSDFRHPSSDFQVPTSDFQVLTSKFRLPSSDFQVPISKFRLQTSTSDFRLPTSNLRLRAQVSQGKTLVLVRDRSRQVLPFGLCRRVREGEVSKFAFVRCSSKRESSGHN